MSENNRLNNLDHVLDLDGNPEDDPKWTKYFGNLVHKDYSGPIFLRHNGSPVDLINLYSGETCYIVGRGPSIKEIVEDKETKKLLLNNKIIKYGMNHSPEVLDFNCNIWSCCDRPSKFPKEIYKNPNIMKLVPLNRYSTYTNIKKAIAYDKVPISMCANSIGVASFLLGKKTEKGVSFSRSFLNSPNVLYGYNDGFKSTFLFVIKVCLLLGFKRVILMGVDFKMDYNEPYYNNKSSEYPKYHVDHNNRLYKSLSPIISEIFSNLEEAGYFTKFYTCKKIEALPFIEKIDIKKTLEEEIKNKS